MIRFIQLLTNIHRICHIRWAFGYVFRPLPWAYFPGLGWRRVRRADYHDCATTGIY